MIARVVCQLPHDENQRNMIKFIEPYHEQIPVNSGDMHHNLEMTMFESYQSWDDFEVMAPVTK
jgi:hypothetical protein